jgi:anti-anti-sigma regulatory factor
VDDPGICTQHMAEHVWRVALSGEHDLSDVAEVEQAIANVFAAGSVLIVDLTEATLIDSTVMNAILYAHELATTTREHNVAVIATPESHTRRALEIGLDGYINVYDSLPAALAAVR